MKSVGEVMAIGRNFKESMQKALRGLETGLDGFNRVRNLKARGATRSPRRSRADAGPAAGRCAGLPRGLHVEEIHAITHYDPWFLRHIEEIMAEEARSSKDGLPNDAAGLRRLKAMGFSDKRLATLAVRSVGVAGGLGETQARRSGLLHDALRRWLARPARTKCASCAQAGRPSGVQADR
jgi:carbamoyl-phosphate synthase large subunit